MSYTGMSELYYRFRDQPFVILAFPSNDFGHQEPNSNSWIEKFVRGTGEHKCGLVYCNWNGTFPYPLFSKCNVKPDWCTVDPAKGCTPDSKDCCSKNEKVWQWLNEKYPNQLPKWNFAGKHLFGKDGQPIKYINDETYDPFKLAGDIQAALAA